MKAKHALGCIVTRSRDVIIPLYLVLVMSHLEYCIHFWSPSSTEILKNWRVQQRRAAKMIRGLEKLTYEERLEKWDLLSLEKRGLREDLNHSL